MFVLAMYYNSPQAYWLMAHIFLFPHISSLHRWVSSFFISSGIPNSLFYVFEQKIKSLAFKDRIGILCLNEICLKTRITYDRRFDVLVGYENLGGKTSKPANNALILLVRGLFFKLETTVRLYVYQCGDES